MYHPTASATTALPILRNPGMPARYSRLRFIEAGDDGTGTPGAPPASDPPANSGNEPVEPATAKPGDVSDEAWKALGDPGKKALVAEREAHEKAKADLAALRKEIEDGKKTAEQKTADDLKAAQDAAAQNAAKALRYEVAASKGLNLQLAARLTGSTKEELEADADALKALIPDAKGTPKPDPSAGATGDVKPKTLNDAITAHYASASS